MSQNPLLGSRISLISKKNIRYEGTLYSINEAEATVALQDVQAYGTEGREKEGNGTFVSAQDTVHAYLLFRGCDIKDLHVHESTSNVPAAEEELEDPAIVSAEPPKPKEEVVVAEESDKDQMTSSATDTEAVGKETVPVPKTKTTTYSSSPPKDKEPGKEQSQAEEQIESTNDENNNNNTDPSPIKTNRNNKSSNNRRKKNNHPKQMVGSGASLLRRKARGVVDGDNGPENAHEKNFDFESNLAEFKNNDDDDVDSNEEEEVSATAYDKNDFFDSISCDVSDRQIGVDNRLRGKEERSLNTETFGATSLGYGRRNNRRYRGRGGGGRGRGRGRGGGGGNRPRENNRWKEGSNQSGSGRGGRGRGGGNRRTYGDGGISAHAHKATTGGQ